MSDPKSAYGLSTGYPDLDRLTGGMHPGQLTFITGNLAVEFGLGLVDRIGVRSGRGVLLCTGGTPKEQVSERLMCCHAGIDSAMLSGEELNESAWATIREAARDLYDSPVFVEDARDLNWAHLVAKCRQVHSEHSVELVVLGVPMAAGRSNDGGRINTPDATPAGTLKALAEELGVPVVVFGTVPPRDAGADGPRELRAEEALERGADVLLRVHSPEHYTKDERMIECLVSKRGVAVGQFNLVFYTKSMRFEEQSERA